MPALNTLNLHKSLIRATDKLGFSDATPVQLQAIPAALEGKDLMVSAQTGSGKTAAFLLPTLNQLLLHDAPNTSTRALILLPTRELALQTATQFNQLAAFTPIKCGVIIGGEAFKHQVATLRKNPEIIIATPGRLVEHIDKATTDFKDLEFLILDEADRMLDMGFAIDMQTIAASCNPQRQNLLFSATLHHKELHRIKATFDNPVSLSVDAIRQDHQLISQQKILCDDIKHKEKVVEAVITEEQAKKVFIFCNKRKQCEQLSHQLRYKKYKSNFIHGDIAQNERKQIMNSFRQGQLHILVATDLAARGLDIEDVDLVINFNIAQSADDHVHRVGRTGRAGQQGKAINLVSEPEWNQMFSIMRFLNIPMETRTIPSLKANYKGPKKLKKSGKAASSKKKKDVKVKNKKPSRDSKSNENSKKPKSSKNRVTGDGHSVIMKKKSVKIHD